MCQMGMQLKPNSRHQAGKYFCIVQRNAVNVVDPYIEHPRLDLSAIKNPHLMSNN